MKRLLLYTTDGCHLCEQAEALITPALSSRDIVLEKVDISACDDLITRYGLRIPVIRWSTRDQELGWPFSEAEFLDYLRLEVSL